MLVRFDDFRCLNDGSLLWSTRERDSFKTHVLGDPRLLDNGSISNAIGVPKMQPRLWRIQM